MIIIYLNCQYGSLKKELFNFLESMIPKTDIFCFQEVSKELQLDFESKLNKYNNIFNLVSVDDPFVSSYGQSIFVNKKIKISNSGTLNFFKNRKPNYGFLQFVDIDCHDQKIRILNIHGRPQPGHKKDTKTRISQSLKIINALNKNLRFSIVGGDFNLNPDTKSIKILENYGLLNLIKIYKIRTTRNRIAWEQAHTNHKLKLYRFYEKQLFSDYCFVSRGIKVNNFKVPNILISDHLPLILEFEV